jgi:glycosyltransferase involved in cell wall biosynthesis
MKICIVGSSKKFFSGISAYTIVMANAFKDRGHDVSVILLRNLVPLLLYPGRDRVGKGEYLLDILPGIDIYNGMDWNSPGSWLEARYFLREQKPDTIIIHWWTSSVAHMQLLLANCKFNDNRCVILEMHEVVDTLEEKIFPIRLYSRLAGRTLIRFCDAYVTHSNEAKGAVVNSYNLNRKKVHVIPHGPYDIYGASDRDAARSEHNLQGFTILCFGTIRHYKGVSILIKAFNQLPPDRANNMHLIVAGEDWGDDPEILPALNASPFRNRIIFKPGFVPDKEVARYFAMSDVVVLPYLRTYGSGVTNIATAQGKYLICSDIPTLRECLEKYDGTSFFPVGDITALRDSLLEAYNNWVISGSQQYNFHGQTWDSIIQSYENLATTFKNNNVYRRSNDGGIK